jgi:hypothetical protein
MLPLRAIPALGEPHVVGAPAALYWPCQQPASRFRLSYAVPKVVPIQ